MTVRVHLKFSSLKANGIHVHKVCAIEILPKKVQLKLSQSILTRHRSSETGNEGIHWLRFFLLLLTYIHTSAHITHMQYFFVVCSGFVISAKSVGKKNEIKIVIRVYIEMWIQYLCYTYRVDSNT